MIILMVFKVLLPWLKVAFPDWCHRLWELLGDSYWNKGGYVWCIAIILFYCLGMGAIKKVKKFKVLENLFEKHKNFFKKHNPYKIWSMFMLNVLLLALLFALGFKVLSHILLPVFGIIFAIVAVILGVVAFTIGVALLANWSKIQTEKMNLCKAWAFKHSNGTPYFCATELTKAFNAMVKKVWITALIVLVLCIAVEIFVGCVVL